MTQDTNQEVTQTSQENEVPPVAPALTVTKALEFFFKGNPETKTKRATIVIPAEIPTAQGLADIVNNSPRGVEKILSLMQDAIQATIRNVLAENPTMTAATFPMEKATWAAYEAIAATERKLAGISADTWKAFRADYIAVMPELAGVSVEQATNAAKKMIDQRCANDKTNKPMLEKLYSRLVIYATQAPNAANFSDCITALDEKIQELVAIDNASLIDNI